jgi:hypothetical protein
VYAWCVCACSELARLATLIRLQASGQADTSAETTAVGRTEDIPLLLNAHFTSLLNLITSPAVSSGGAAASPAWTKWSGHSAHKAAFEVLVRECPVGAWGHSALIVQIIAYLGQRKERPAEGSAEAIAANYVI